MNPKRHKRKPKRGDRPQRAPPFPPEPELEDMELEDMELEDMEPIVFETPIGDVVLHMDMPPYVKYFIFRPDQPETVAEFEARRKAGEQIDFQEEWRQIARFAELNVAIDEDGFYAELYLDRSIVQEDEVEEIIEGVCGLLEQIDIGSYGGDLGVYWMEEIVNFTFPAEVVNG